VAHADPLGRGGASWGAFLAALAQASTPLGASVTIEPAPDPGARLRTEMARRIQPGSPELARAVLEEVASTYPRTGAITTARIALTWGCARAGGGRRGLDAMAGELARRLPGICLALAGTGAGAARPMGV